MPEDHHDSSKRSKPWFRRHAKTTLLAINLLQFLLIGLAFEVALRLVSPDWLKYRMDFLAHGGDVDDFGTDRSWKTVRNNGLFLSFEPHSSFDILHAEYQNVALIDELGGRELDPEFVSEQLLPCLGDSFTFGVGVENDETFVNHLQASTEIGKAVRLVNLGVPGSALPDQRFIVERRHDELGKPPIYLIFFFLGNDFAGILDSAARKESPVGRESAPNDRTAWRTLSAKVNAYVNQSWLRHSYAIQLTKRVLMQVTSDTRRNLVFYMMEPENTAYHRRVREALQSELARWSEIGRGTQFEVVVMFVPDCYQVIAARREKQAGYYGTEPADLDPLLPNTILAEALKGEGIRFIDPTRDLMEMADAEILFYVKDNHFTAEGHRRFAEAVSRRLDVSLVGLRPRKVTIPRQATKHLDVRRLSNPATIP